MLWLRNRPPLETIGVNKPETNRSPAVTSEISRDKPNASSSTTFNVSSPTQSGTPISGVEGGTQAITAVKQWRPWVQDSIGGPLATIESSKSIDIGINYGLSFLGNSESPRNLQWTEAEWRANGRTLSLWSSVQPHVIVIQSHGLWYRTRDELYANLKHENPS